MERICPHAAEVRNEAKAALARRQPPILHVTRPALQRELLEMEERDQAARDAWIEDISDRENPQLRAVEEVDMWNLRRLKHILRQDGFPTAAMVGYNGVSSAWLLLQHADTDPAVQARWLPVIKNRARTGDLSTQQVALLTDRVLLHRGNKQIYGSQITLENGEFRPLPVADEPYLDQRRRSVGLMPMADYLCMMRVIVQQPGDSERR